MHLLTSHQASLIAEGVVLAIAACFVLYLLLQASSVLFRLLDTNRLDGTWRKPGEVVKISWRLPSIESGMGRARLRKAWRPQLTAFR